MARRFLCVWERGGGSGHLYRISSIVGALKRAGHAVYLSIKDVGYSRRFLTMHDVVVRAPAACMKPAAGTGIARSHAELLLNLGFGDRARLMSYLRRWRSLLIEIGPSAVFCDHADGALLAAYSLGIPVMVVGNSFFHPPEVSPFPAYDLGLELATDDLWRVEARVLEAINSALKTFGGHPIANLAELYTYAERVVLSFPQLDCYGVRSGLDYLGVPGPTQTQAQPVWNGAGEKVFCYFTRGRTPDKDFLRQLLGEGYSLLIAAPGMSEKQRDALRKLGVAVEDRHVDLEQVCAECRLIFSEGNHSTTSTILRYGRAPLLLPRQVEQLATAKRLADQSLGVLPDPTMREPIYLSLIDRMDTQPEYDRNAQSFCRQYRGWDAQACAEKLASAVADFVEA